jgi:hypothetical protein
MKEGILRVVATAMLLIVGLIAPAIASVGGDFGACDGLEWLKYEYDEDRWESSVDAPSSDTITLTNWVSKDGEAGEPIGFDWSSTIVVDSVHTKSGNNSPLDHPGGMEGSVNTGAGPGQPAISFIVFCFDEPGPPPPTPDSVTIQKVWTGDFDGDGVTVTFSYELTDAGDSVTSGTVPEGGTVALPPGGSSISWTGESFDPALPDGCVSAESYELIGAIGDTRGYANSGQGLLQTFVVTNDVTCEGAPETVTITLAKEWFDIDGNKRDSAPGLPWTVELYTSMLVDEEVVDNVEVTLGDLEDRYEAGPVITDPFELTEGGIRYGVREDIAAGEFVVVDCATVDTDTAYDEQGVRTTNDGPVFEDTFHLVCNRSTVIPPNGTPPQTDDEVLGETLERRTVVAEREVEVLGETLTRTTPTRVDTGTGGSLDNSGLLTLLLLGGLALSGFGIASATTARRR